MSTPGPHPLAPRTPGWYPDPAGTAGQRWHDGQGWTGQVTHVKPAEPLGPGFARLGDWLGRLLALCALGGLLLTVAAVFAWMIFSASSFDASVLNSASTTPVEPSSGEELGGASLAIVLGYCFGLLLYAATGITWLVWQYQLAVKAPGPLRRSPGWHIADWFIPFLSWWRPRGDLADIWGAYSKRGSDPAPWSLTVWWGCLVVVPYLIQVFVVISVFRAPTAGAFVHNALGWSALWWCSITVAAVAARSVVHSVSWRALLYWTDAS